MTSLDINTKPRQEPSERLRAGDGPRERLCLMCRIPFNSFSSSNRVCRKCKSTTMWKEGDSLADHVCSRNR
jgi:hypothetical protein